MLANFCFFSLSLLAVRSLVLAVFESKRWQSRLADLLVAVLFGSAALILAFFLDLPDSKKPLQAVLLFILLALITALFVASRLKRPYTGNRLLLILKALFSISLLVLSFTVLMMAGFLRLTQDEPILRVTMPGTYREELVEWKSPVGTLQKQRLKAYEVLFYTEGGAPVARLFVYGDQVAVKAEVLRFHPVLNVLGFHNLFQIDYVFNGYTSAERHNTYPHLAQQIALGPPYLAPLQDRFWKIWEQHFYQESKLPWIKSATLESNFFPLVRPDGRAFRGSYFLTVNPGGLSAVRLP